MGFVAHLPVGLSLFSGRWRDREVIEMAWDYEQRTGHRRAPPADACLGVDVLPAAARP